MKSQSGILVDGNTDGYFGLFNVNYNLLSSDHLRCNSLLHDISQFQLILQQYSTSTGTQVVGCIGFGKKFWDYISELKHIDNSQNKIMSFPNYGDKLVSTQNDLFVHIHSIRHDIIFDISCLVMDKLFHTGILILYDEIYGFKFKDSRDLTGFVDGTENPKGNELRSLAALDSEGNSYSIVQKYVHNLNKFHNESLDSQENIIGRTKKDSVELSDKLPTSHISRTDIKNEHGKEMKIVRHSLPYGSACGDKGLIFTAYCNDINTFDIQIKSMFGLRDEHSDRLMEFSKPISSSYFYIPNEDVLSLLTIH